MNAFRNTIIFDLDGTLLNTLGDLTDSVNHVMKQYHFPPHSTEQVRLMIGNGIYNLFEQAIPNGSSNPAYTNCIQEFQTYYKAHMQLKTCPYEGIHELLCSLTQNNYQLAVVSNKFDAAVKSLCKHYFGNTIPVAIGESSAISRKPAPDTVFEAMKQLHVLPENCIYVGDSDVDILTAQNAKIPCISVTWGFRNEDFLLKHGATHIVSSPDELFHCIHQLKCKPIN